MKRQRVEKDTASVMEPHSKKTSDHQSNNTTDEVSFLLVILLDLKFPDGNCAIHSSIDSGECRRVLLQTLWRQWYSGW